MDFNIEAPRYIRNVSDEEADIFLFDQIGGGGISGQEFADEIKMLNEFGVKTINVHINSGGGSVIDGFSIFSAITSSKATIHTINVGIAGSMAGVILLAGDKVSMVDFAKVMVHNVSGSKDPDENEQKAIDALQDAITIILTNRTKKGKKALTEMMNVETWLNAKQAKEMGFVDEIISSKASKKNTNRLPAMEIMNILNNVPTPNTNNMKTVLAFLGLDENASETAALAAVTKIKNDLEKEVTAHEATTAKLGTAEGIVVKQKEKIDKFDEEQATLNEKLVTDTLATAVKEKKIEEKQVEELAAHYKNDITGLQLVLGAIKSTAPNIKAQLESNTGDTIDKDIPEDRKGWDLVQWQKEDQKGIDAIMNANPDLYAKLHLKTYGVELEVA